MAYKLLVQYPISLMDSLVKPMYISGSDFIEAFQWNYRGWESLFLMTYKLTNPWVAYFFIFPMIYYYHMRMGLRIVWAAAVTEYVCIIFKLLLHGHRPYWYAVESLYHITSPKIRQIDGWSCDTTPATPSSRAMMSACIGYILAKHYCHCKGYTPVCYWNRYAGVWAVYYTFQILVMMAGAFTASTFPHQALIGSVMGSLIASRLSKTDVLEITFKQFCWVISAMMSIFFVCYGGLWLRGYDPAWAMSKASMACMKLHWGDMYREALVTHAFRAAGLATGVGLSLRFFTADKLKITDGCKLAAKLVHGVVGSSVIMLLDIFLLPPFGYGPFLYYGFLFIKYTVPPLLIITEVPFITGVSKLIICELVVRGNKGKYAEMLGGDPMIPLSEWSDDSVCTPSPLGDNECCISTLDMQCVTSNTKTKYTKTH